MNRRSLIILILILCLIASLSFSWFLFSIFDSEIILGAALVVIIVAASAFGTEISKYLTSEN